MSKPQRRVTSHSFLKALYFQFFFYFLLNICLPFVIFVSVMTTFFLRNNEKKGVEISLSPGKTQICIFRKEVISSDNFVFTLQIPAHQYSQGSAQITADVKLNLYFWQLSSRVILPIIKTNISRMMWIKRPRPSI